MVVDDVVGVGVYCIVVYLGVLVYVYVGVVVMDDIGFEVWVVVDCVEVCVGLVVDFVVFYDEVGVVVEVVVVL